MSPKTDLPPALLARWDALLALIRRRMKSDVFLVVVADMIPLPTGQRRQVARVRQWINGEVLPSAPICLEILRLAVRARYLTRKELLAAYEEENPPPVRR